MTIDKAIEILEGMVTYRDCFDNTDKYHALKLGIEALKRCRILAQESTLWALHPLPGETED